MPKAPTLRLTPEEHVRLTDQEVAWLRPYKRALQPTWDKQVAAALAEEQRIRSWQEEIHPKFGRVIAFKELTGAELEQLRRDITGRFVENAERDLQNHNAEISSMMTRTSIIVAAATLMFALFTLGFDPQRTVRNVILTVTLTVTALAFITAIRPLRPPFMRAWFEPFNLREHWTLIAADDFTRWVMTCMLGNRRTPVITVYKKAHAIAVPLLVLGSIGALATLITRLFV